MGIRSTYNAKRLERILSSQDNLVTRHQLLECEMTRSAIQHRVKRGGRWRIILPGVYTTIDGAVSARQRQVAALLYAGEEAVITGAFAARLYGLVAPGPDYIDVLVPVRVRKQSFRFVRVIHTARMPEQVFRNGSIRIAGPDRAIADAVRGYREIEDARSLICTAIQRRQCSLAGLASELSAGPKRGSALLRQGLRDAAKGIWSAAEGQLMDLIERSDLPEPEYNVALYASDGEFLGIVDAWWEQAGVAAEVDSREFHFSGEDWRETMRRHNQLTKHRVQLMHFPPVRIQTSGDTVIAELRSAIKTGLTAPPLSVRAVSQRVDCAIDT